MKNILNIAIFMAVSTSVVIAQDDSESKDNREKLQFGLKAGVNNSNVYDSKGEEFDADSKFGFVGGAVIVIPLGKYLGLQPEVLLSQKGFRANGRILNNTYSFTRTTTYLDIPLQLALKPSEFITLLAGPQFSYLLKQQDVFSNSVYSYEQENEFKQDNARKNTLGAVVGLDINLKHITLGARMAWDLQTNAGDGTSSTPRYKNVWLQGTIGYRFYSN